jgi:hypothetical protein
MSLREGARSLREHYWRGGTFRGRLRKLDEGSHYVPLSFVKMWRDKRISVFVLPDRVTNNNGTEARMCPAKLKLTYPV